jgi:hypothetical protein
MLLLGNSNQLDRRSVGCSQNQPKCQHHRSHWLSLELSGTHICMNLAIQIHVYKHIWKTKVLPTRKTKVLLRIINFTWYHRRGVILRKDNRTKCNWQGSTKCCFCHPDENIKHLFFQYQFLRFIWSAIQVDSNLYSRHTIANL